MRRWLVIAGSIGVMLVLILARGHGVAAQSKPTVTLAGQQLFHTVDLPPGISTFTVTCPAGFSAVGGGIVPPLNGNRLLASVPVGGPRTWKFSIGVGPQGGRVTVVVTCIRPLKVPPLPGLPKKLKPLIVSKALILKAIKGAAPVAGPGEQKKMNLKCPGGYAPDSYGIDQTYGEKKYGAAAPISPNATLRTELTGAMPVPGGYEFTVRNFSTSAPDPGETTTLAVMCSKRDVAFRYGPRGRRRTLHVLPTILRSSSKSDVSAESFATITQRCPAGTVATGFGYDFGSRDAFFAGGYAWGTDGRVTMDVLNGEPAPTAIETFALCMLATVRQAR